MREFYCSGYVDTLLGSCGADAEHACPSIGEGMRRIGRHNQDVARHRVDALVVGGEDGASLPSTVNCDNASHATSRYFNESNQPFSPDETPRSVQPGPRDRHLTRRYMRDHVYVWMRK
jgi:hypothetical protein